jgi:aspartokinase/homoserine dehydrogenase 1
MLIQKFGGTSLAGIKGFTAAGDIIENGARDEPVVVVLSAVKGITDLLQAAIDSAQAGQHFETTLEQVTISHNRVLNDFATTGVNVEETRVFMQLLHRRLASRLEGIRLLGSCPEDSRAEIMASGEAFSSRLMAETLRHRGLAAVWSDTDILPPANESRLDTLVDIDAAGPRLRDCMVEDIEVLVLPGFYCRNQDQGYQLLGRNGSDYSAAAVAAALGARLLQIWKDVDGFFTADPSIVSNARCLEEVSYDEAMELSYFGAKVVSSKALAPLATHRIPCEIRNTYHPGTPGTLIHGGARRTGVVRGLSHLDHVASITLQGSGMRGRVGIARRVMEALASRSISVLLIVQSSSEYSITLCVRTHEAGRAHKALQAEFHFECLHGLITEISVQTERAVISLVGEGMKHYRGIAARFLTAISSAGVNAEVIAQGSTECAIAVVVTGREARAALRASHTAFFSHTHHIDVILLGCGNVGSVLLGQFRRQHEKFGDDRVQGGGLHGHRTKLHVRAIANSRKLLVASDTVDLEHWEETLEQDGKSYTLDDVIAIRQQLGLLNPTVIDCTTNEELAGDYLRLLSGGFNVVAANKKANTAGIEYYRELRECAERYFRKFLYETNVGAGLPVIDTLQSLIRSGDRLKNFEGILSGSLSMIFGLMEDGKRFSQAVSEAMQLGFTEPDPRDDLSGMDVARKLLIIAREVGLELELDAVEIEPVLPAGFAYDEPVDKLVAKLESLDEVFAEKVRQANEAGQVLRFVGSIDGRRCRVAVKAVPVDHPLAAIRDGENALVLHTRYYQPIPLVLRGYGAGAEVTAAGVFGDLLRTAWRPLDQ